MPLLPASLLLLSACASGPPTGSDAEPPVDSDPPTPASVHTLFTHSGAGDDLTLHPAGFLIASDPLGEGSFSSPEGTRLLKIPFEGEPSTLLDGLRRPVGNTIGPDGTLYACEWSGFGAVFRARPGAAVEEIATGLSYPSNVVVMDDGEVWVSEWGANRVLAIAEDGSTRTVAELSGPVGMERDGEGVLVAGGDDGTVWRLNVAGEATVLGVVEESGSLAVVDLTSAADGIYATSFSGHRVWRIADGQAAVFAGSGERATRDGVGVEAAFDQPNGIAASEDGLTLYVQEMGGALRQLQVGLAD
ncbi:MAG: SMP-30/gluconolactonase/LRE family protein [Alphaproteobacteria bacterium]|nr:SMP-30/gluconolactonase/LRE family protein [Alphaproteobacteria bacterium]